MIISGLASRNSRIGWKVGLWALLSICLVGGCRHTGVAQDVGRSATDCKSDVTESTLGSGDIFDVRVFEEQQLSGTYRVSPDGTIAFPLVGQVEVSGRSPQQVGRSIETKLAQGFLRNPQVSIFVKEYNSKKISVLGQVAKPGTFPYIDAMTVIEALTLAGGLTPIAAKNDTVITRSDKSRMQVKVEDISEGKALNVCLHPGDIVFVPERIF